MVHADRDNSFATLVEPATLTIQRWFPGPVERVWRYLTDSDLRRQWLAAGDMPSVTGECFSLVWRNDTLSRSDDPRPEGFGPEHRMETRIVSIEPMKHLAFTWGAGEVRFELEPKGDKVLLTLTHTGIQPDSRIMIAAGWHMHLDILVARTEGREPGSFWSGWRALKGTYEVRL